jgi:exopolysaccharide biosynthesis polyprenyl glycosylphosphotransferase
MDLAVAVINYNTREHLRRCLASLPAELHREPLPVLVVDNASPDGSAAMVAAELGGRVTLVANRANLGFARAVNQALELTQTRYLLVLNADTEVPGGSIEALYDFMERTPRAGVAGGRLEDPEGNLQHSCRRFYDATTLVLRRTPLGRVMPRHPALRRHLMADWDHAETREVDWMQGACLMLRREAVAEVGPMDERFFLYFEDVDLCRRLGQAGWGVFYVPEARFVHHYRRGSHGGLLSREKLHHLQSGLRYLAKWNPGAARAVRWMRWMAALPLLAADLAIINGGFFLCLLLRDLLGGPLPRAAVAPSTYHPMLVGANVLLLLTFVLLGLYRVDRSRDWLALWSTTIKAVTWVALFGVVALFFAPGYRHGFIYSRLLMLLYYALLVGAVATTRLARRALLRLCWRRHLLLRRVILAGEVEPLARMAEAVRHEPDCGYEVAGTMALPEAESGADDRELMPRFEALLGHEQPGGVFFVTQRAFHPYLPLVLCSFESNLDVRVATPPHLFPFIHRTGSAEVCGLPAADVTRTPLYALKRSIKRVSDVTLTLLVLPVVGPAMLLLALAIRLTDGGPGFFRQRRVGKHGRTFTMIKLRTMKVDATVDEQANIAEGPLTLIPNDPRVTGIGRWLRRHKLDELPQLVNVLLGQMSLVGPRPPTAEEVERYTEWQKGRLSVRPGITGLWQIDKQRKWRFNEMVELDLQYILNWSPLSDYGIMLRTIPAVLRGS